MRAPAGLPNLGNTCFLNASLQVLRRWGLLQSCQDPHEIRAKLGPAWQDGRQHDAHEAVLALLDMWNHPVEMGDMESIVTCGATNDISAVSEPFCVLSLPIADHLAQALQQFENEKEELTGENVWISEKARRRRVTPARSFKSMRVRRWPPGGVLLHLKRFSNARRKLVAPVELPPRWGRARLAAAALHWGSSAHGGHYTAAVRAEDDENTWYHCDDSSVTAMSAAQALDEVRKRAYLALYLPSPGSSSSLHWWR